MLVYDRETSLETPTYFVALDFHGDRVVSIHDFLFARYAINGIDLALLNFPQPRSQSRRTQAGARPYNALHIDMPWNTSPAGHASRQALVTASLPTKNLITSSVKGYPTACRHIYIKIRDILSERA
jgi:hypothetical protein